jgi:hypothetical protein
MILMSVLNVRNDHVMIYGQKRVHVNHKDQTAIERDKITNI